MKKGTGHRVPPKEHRFGPGKAGNTKGRPKGSKNTRTIVRDLAAERHVVKENGQSVGYTTAELLFITLARKAMTGDVRASRLLDKYRAMFELEPEEMPGGVLLVFETMTMDEFELHLEAHNARRAYLERSEWAAARDG
jgi:hypothetical protein